MPFEGTLYKNCTSLHCYEGSMGEFTSNDGLKHDNRTFVSIENTLEFFELVMKKDFHEILPVFN